MLHEQSSLDFRTTLGWISKSVALGGGKDESDPLEGATFFINQLEGPGRHH